MVHTRQQTLFHLVCAVRAYKNVEYTSAKLYSTFILYIPLRLRLKEEGARVA